MAWLDTLIGWVSPERAARREGWRLYRQMVRNYDAAGDERLNAGWRVAGTASAEVTDAGSREIIRSRARDLERNSDIAKAVVLAYTRNVVGGGFTLQARTGDEELNDRIETLWAEWCKAKNCDVTGQQSFNQLLRMCVERKKVDGGVLIHKVYTQEGTWPFKLQLLEVDELSMGWAKPHNKNHQLAGGIEYDAYNKPVGYWITPYSLDGMAPTEPVYVKAQNMIFYYSKHRPSQVREISDLSVSMTRIRDANEFMTALSLKERIAACLAVIVRHVLPNATIGRGGNLHDKTTGYDGKTITPGMIMDIGTADDVSVVNPGGGSADGVNFLKTQLRLIGAGQGLSYMTMTRDLSGMNYSGARQAAIEDGVSFQEEQELLQEKVMDEVYETFVISCVLLGMLPVDAAAFFGDQELKRRYLKHEWIAAKKPWVDPGKEASAQKTALETGSKTYKQIAAEGGYDWQEQLRDMAEVNALCDELGLPHLGPGGENESAAAPEGDNTPMEV